MHIDVTLTTEEVASLLEAAPAAVAYWGTAKHLGPAGRHLVIRETEGTSGPHHPRILGQTELEIGVAMLILNGGIVTPHYGIGGLDRDAVDRVVQYGLFRGLRYG